MTTSGAYNAGLPCKNPSCKSEGKPHPNCGCYGGMAKGGEVKNYCDKNQAHKKGCEYFAEGGETGADINTSTSTSPGFISDKDFVPDQPKAAPGFISDKDFVPDQTVDSSKPPGFIPDDQFVSDNAQKYNTLPQQIGAGIEGLAQGVAGPLAVLGEKGLSKLGVPGLTDEDINGREAANPVIHGLGEAAGIGASLLTGTGEAALATKAALKAAEFAKLTEATALSAKIGSRALQGAIQSGLIQAGDSVSKAMLGQGDPNDAVAGALADGAKATLIGGVTGGLGGLASKGLESVGKNLEGTYLHSFLSGIGGAANGADAEQSYARYLDPKAYDKGMKWWNNKVALASGAGSLGVLGDVAYRWNPDDIEGGLKDAGYDILKAAGLGYAINKISGPASAILLKALSNGETNPRSLFQMMDYADRANSGAQKMSRGVENLFKVGGQQLSDKYDFDSGRSKLNKFIEDGGINQNINQTMEDQHNEQAPQVPAFAEGGEVKNTQPLVTNNDPVAEHLPDQNILLNTAKGRVSTYLSGIKPQKDAPRLAFDPKPDQSVKQRSYNMALDIANHPMSILDKIKTGTIDAEHVQHFNAMYPEINNALQKKLTDRISQAQLKGEKPSYAIRQGMSLLMGAPLSSEMSPQNIQAAQAVFQSKQQQPEGEGSSPKGKKNSSSLSKSNQAFLTGNQSLVGRQQKGA